MKSHKKPIHSTTMPPSRDKNPKRVHSAYVRLDDHTWNALRKAADLEDRTLSYVMYRILREWAEQDSEPVQENG